MLRNWLFSLLGAAALTVAALPASAQEADPSLVTRGEYLATAGDCAACHGNPKTHEKFAGGYAVESPLGIIYGSNITPSKTDGIGNYSLADFARVLRKGIAPGNHFLYPAMPYTAFAGMSDDDIKALYAYFMLGVKPVDEKAPETKLGFPFSIRSVMFGWNLLFAHQDVVPGSTGAPGSAERGKYLVDTLTHCSTCHTPRGTLMQEDMGKFLGGGKVGTWTAPNITSDVNSGIGSWGADDIYTYLKTGMLHGKADAAGEMGTAVTLSLSKLTDDDLHAIAAYIKTVPPVSDGSGASRFASTSKPAPVSSVERPMGGISTYVGSAGMSGAQLYNAACATCHMNDGRGTQDSRHFFPPLVGTSAVGAADPSNLILTIAYGVDRNLPDGHVFMPTFHNQLSNGDLAKVADYVSTAFGDPSHHVTEKDVDIALAGGKPNWLLKNADSFSIAGIFLAIIVVVLIVAWLTRPRPGATSVS